MRDAQEVSQKRCRTEAGAFAEMAELAPVHTRAIEKHAAEREGGSAQEQAPVPVLTKDNRGGLLKKPLVGWVLLLPSCQGIKATPPTPPCQGQNRPKREVLRADVFLVNGLCKRSFITRV